MSLSHRTLGTQLRHLIEMLDNAVETGYDEAQLDYRARYTPVLRALMDIGPASIKSVAERAGLTHSAASQTAAQMMRSGLLEGRRGKDMREQVLSITLKAAEMIPELQRIWTITNEAAKELDAELAFPLSQLLEDAIDALERQSFTERRRAVAQSITKKAEIT